jgi:hypothetical protein
MDINKGLYKRWIHSVHESCWRIGVAATAKEFNISEKDVQNTTMSWDGFDGKWEDYVEFGPDGPDDINKDDPRPPN